MTRFLVYLQIDGWLLGLASVLAIAVFARRREVGFAFLAVAICAHFASKAIAAWIFADSSHMAPASSSLVAVARTCEASIAPILLVVGLLLLVRGAHGECWKQVIGAEPERPTERSPSVLFHT